MPRIVAVADVLTLSAGECSNIGSRDTTGSINLAKTAPAIEAEWQRSLETLRARYRDNTSDTAAAIADARELGATALTTQNLRGRNQASSRS